MLITGGCKNGKSFYAQTLIDKIAGSGEKFYVATMEPYDEEDNTRIARHKAERAGWGFVTIEQHHEIAQLLHRCGKEDSVLLDSTTALLMNEMFLPNGKVDQHAYKKVISQLVEVCRGVGNIAVVSDWIYSDAESYGKLTEEYRYGLAMIDRALAKELEIVCQVSFGNLIFHKGENPL